MVVLPGGEGERSGKWRSGLTDAQFEETELNATKISTGVAFMNTARFFSQNAVRATSVGVPFGRVLFDQGQAGDAFYVVQSGRLRVIKRDAEGRSRTVGYLYEGDHFGEGALLTGQGHRAKGIYIIYAVVTVSECTGYYILILNWMAVTSTSRQICK